MRGLKWGITATACALGLTLMSWFLELPGSRAQEIERVGSMGNWEKLSNGQVGIDVKGVHFAFPSEGSDVELITFSSRSKKLTLQQVIASPVEARTVFSQGDPIVVHIPVVTSRNDLWLRRFDRWEFRTLRIDIVVGGRHAVANCDAWEADIQQLKATLKSGDSNVGPDGWAEFARGKSPLSRVYIDTQTSAYFPGVICNELKTCYVPKCLSSNVGLSYSFAEAVYGRASWRAFNLKVQNVLKPILIDLMQ